jgi:single-stranded-DNA-specific exonuclease
MLTFCSDLLEHFGGHSGAGGFSVTNENIPGLTARIQEFAKQNHNIMPIVEVVADSVPDAAELSVENVADLSALDPFGEGNPTPVICMKNCVIKHKKPLKDMEYTSFIVQYQNRDFKVLDFGRCYSHYSEFWYKAGDVVDIMVSPFVNDFSGHDEVNCKLIDIRLAGLTCVQDRYFAAKDIYERIRREEEIDDKLYPRIIPSDDDMKKVYTIIKSTTCVDGVCLTFIDELTQRGLAAGINYCMLRVTLDVFEQAGLIEINYSNGAIKTIKHVKANLSESNVLVKLRERGT